MGASVTKFKASALYFQHVDIFAITVYLPQVYPCTKFYRLKRLGREKIWVSWMLLLLKVFLFIYFSSNNLFSFPRLLCIFSYFYTFHSHDLELTSSSTSRLLPLQILLYVIAPYVFLLPHSLPLPYDVFFKLPLYSFSPDPHFLLSLFSLCLFLRLFSTGYIFAPSVYIFPFFFPSLFLFHAPADAVTLNTSRYPSAAGSHFSCTLSLPLHLSSSS